MKLLFFAILLTSCVTVPPMPTCDTVFADFVKGHASYQIHIKHIDVPPVNLIAAESLLGDGVDILWIAPPLVAASIDTHGRWYQCVSKNQGTLNFSYDKMKAVPPKQHEQELLTPTLSRH